MSASHTGAIGNANMNAGMNINTSALHYEFEFSEERDGD